MSGYFQDVKHRYIISVVVALIALAVIGGIGYAFTTPYILQVNGGDGFLSNVDPDAGEDAPLRVIDFQVGKTDVASKTEIEIEAMVANYGNEVKNDVIIKPVLTSRDGTTDVSDKMDLRPTESYTVEQFEPGSIKTFNFYAEFRHEPIESGQQELTYKLKLTDKNGDSDINDIKQSDRLITILPEGTSTAGSSFIDREPFSISTFPVDKYKDKFVDERDVIGADRSIPPVDKDSNGDISDIDVAEGEVVSYGALTQTDTRNSGTISAVGGKMRIGFGFESIPDRNHYVVRLAHEDDKIEEDIELKLVNSKGNEIDKNSTYMVSPADGEIQQFDYHLTEKEVDHIRSRGDVYMVSEIEGGGSTTDADIENTYYMSLLGVNRVVDLPSSDLKVTNMELVDPNHRMVSGRPTYDIDQEIEIRAEITNEGSGSYSGDIPLNELNQGFTSARSVNTSTIINPGQTRVYNLETTATRPGTHSYVIDDESLCASGANCPLQLQVRESADDLVPRISTDSPSVIAEETSTFNLDGVFSDDYSSINSISWSFGDDEQTFGDAGNGVTVDHVFTERGRKTVGVEVEYNENGDTRTAKHSIFVDVIERPIPEINAVYYDVKTGDRGGTRTGETYGPGIGGEIVSDSCEDQCGGEMSVAGISPQMTEGLSMMVVDKKFASNEDSKIVHYGTYDFQENRYASNDGAEFNGELEDELSPGSIPAFQDHVDEHAGEGKIFIFVGGGDPSIPIDIEDELEQMGAKFGGYNTVGENVPYTFITESQSPSQYEPLHESILPPTTGDSLAHNIKITPVKVSDSDVPTDQEVYLNVRDSNGSDYYQSLEDDQISYSWSGVDSRGDYGYIVPSSSISASVDLSDMPISDGDQQDSVTISVDDKKPDIQASATKSVIEDGGDVSFTAAYSYDSDDRIDPNKLGWSVNSPSGTSITTVNPQSKQSITVSGGDTPGSIQATLLYEGREMDTAEAQLVTEAEARFDYNRIAGLIDHNRGTVSPAETVIYGDEGNSNSLSELDLSSLTSNVRSTFGNGFVFENDNTIEINANSAPTTSASRFVQSNSLDLGLYDSIYLSYSRTISSDSANPTGEVGYVSLHTGEITSEKFTYGEKGTLRGTDTDIAMTSDVVTDEQSNTRHGIMELDVSGVSKTAPVTVHARANAENDGTTSVSIYEMWAGGRDSVPSTSSLFDSNIYPSELSEDVQYISSRRGLGFKSTGFSEGSLQSKSFESGFLESEYNVPSDASNNFAIETGGIDVTTGLNVDSVRTNGAGSSSVITGESSGQPLLMDYVINEVDSSNTDNPLVVLDASNSAALAEDDYSWSASDASAVDIEDPNSIRTVAEFVQTGEHDITLSVDSSFGFSTKTKTIQVDSTAPDISVQMPSNSNVGDQVPINIENTGGSDVEETVVMFGNGEKATSNGVDSLSYEYTNPGSYEVTVVSRNSDGVTSSDSEEITIGTLGVEVVDSISQEVFIPNDAYFDATGTTESVPEESQPSKLIDLSNSIENEDEMSYTWEVPDGSTYEGSTYQHPVNSEGVDNIDLIVQGPSGQTETMDIELEKSAAVPTIEGLSTTPDTVKTFDSFDIRYSIDQPDGVDAQTSIKLNDGTENITGVARGSLTTQQQSTISTLNRDPGDLPDSYTVELYVENEYSESAYETTQLQVESGPEANFQFIGNQPFTVGQSVSLDASESVEPYGNDLTYDWTFYDGEDTVTVTNTGDSTVQYAFQYVSDETKVELEVTDSNGDSDTVEQTVSIDSDATAGLNAQSVQRTGDSHEFEFDASSSSAGGTNNNIETYKFDFDNDGSYEQTSPDPVVSYAYGESGEFRATVQVEDSFGSTASATTTISSTLAQADSCREILESGQQESGTYVINPNGQPIEVYCDMDTNGGGWTKINTSIAKEMVNKNGGGLEAKQNTFGSGFDGDKPYFQSRSTGPGGGMEYDINAGFEFDQMYLENVGFKSTSFKTSNGDTSEYFASRYQMNSWEYTGGGPSNFKGDIGFGVAADSGPTTTYTDAGGSFGSNSGVTDFPFNIGTSNGQVFNTESSDTTLRIAASESGGQDEGWRWERGSIYVRQSYDSCKSIKDANPSAESGEYTIQPDGTNTNVDVYCEMSPDTSSGSAGTFGGPDENAYTFKYVRNGQTTRKVSDSNTCKANDMSLFQPRGPDEYDVGRNYVIDDAGYPPSDWDDTPDMGRFNGGGPGGGLGPLGVHISVNGESADNANSDVNFDSQKYRIMKSEHYGIDSQLLGTDNLYGEGSNGWKTTISEKFWVSTSSVDPTEPNGDYDANTWLGWQNYDSDGYITDYNDLPSANYGYDTYLCWLSPE